MHIYTLTCTLAFLQIDIIKIPRVFKKLIILKTQVLFRCIKISICLSLFIKQ